VLSVTPAVCSPEPVLISQNAVPAHLFSLCCVNLKSAGSPAPQIALPGKNPHHSNISPVLKQALVFTVNSWQSLADHFLPSVYFL